MNSLAYKLAHKRILAVQEIVDDWDLNVDPAQVVFEAEQLFPEVIDLLAPTRRAIAAIGEEPAGDSFDTHVQSAHQLGWLMSKAHAVFESAEGAVVQLRRRGIELKCGDQLEAACRDLQILRERFSGRWMLPTKQAWEESERAIAEGRFITL